jgi:16S rRNA (guanine527-N7)-methyltransferase
VSGFDRKRAEQAIERIAAALAAPIASEARAALLAYVELVAGWSKRVNLTGARDEPALCEVLLADALVLARGALIGRDARLLDVGTGAGAPIMPLLALRTDLSASCLEPLHKRAALLRTGSVRLALHPRMRVHEQRVEPAAPVAPDGPFELALSRATFDPATWLQVGLALAPSVLVFLGDAEPPPAPAGAACVQSETYALPFSHAPRTVARYDRLA